MQGKGILQDSFAALGASNLQDGTGPRNRTDALKRRAGCGPREKHNRKDQKDQLKRPAKKTNYQRPK